MPDQIIRRKAHPLYSTWMRMRERCNSHACPSYVNYGGRGIAICPAWDDFWVFAADMGERPEGHTVDRIDNSGDYGPDNCRWATRKEQANNRRHHANARMFTLDGVSKHLSAWARELDTPISTLYNRHHSGWSDERVLTTPVDVKRRRKT